MHVENLNGSSECWANEQVTKSDKLSHLMGDKCYVQLRMTVKTVVQFGWATFWHFGIDPTHAAVIQMFG